MSRQDGYARLQNSFWRSPKGMKLKKRNPTAGFLYILSISYAADNMTDGHISEDVAYYALDATDEQIRFLVEEGYWDTSEDGDGWRIHDYLEHQNSREQIEAARAKDRARKKTTRKPSNQPETGFHTESNRNPTGDHTDCLTENRKQQTTNSSSHEEEGETRASAPATTAENYQLEARIIDLWEPDASAQATADEKTRAGYPRVDLDALATRFRRKLHARGLTAYKLLPTRESLSAEFCTWVEREAEFMAERTKGTPTPPRLVAPPHEHTMACEHVLDLLTPHEHMFDHEGGRGANPWINARSELANLLNHGMDAQTALADILARQEADA